MKKFRRKFFQGRCPNCEDVQKMKLLETYDELGAVKMRCLNCSREHTYPVERVRRTGRVLTKEQFQRFKTAMSKVLTYRPNDSYFVGQKIHHPVYDEVGEVIKKEMSEGEHRVIVVKFANAGKKRLVERHGS